MRRKKQRPKKHNSDCSDLNKNEGEIKSSIHVIHSVV